MKCKCAETGCNTEWNCGASPTSCNMTYSSSPDATTHSCFCYSCLDAHCPSDEAKIKFRRTKLNPSRLVSAEAVIKTCFPHIKYTPSIWTQNIRGSD
jgi:hypothetical protein